MNVLITYKDCLCVNEPMGSGGLEGYVRGEKYKCQRLEKDNKGNPYYRVFFPDDLTTYETCGVGTFKQHFKIVKEVELNNQKLYV